MKSITVQDLETTFELFYGHQLKVKGWKLTVLPDQYHPGVVKFHLQDLKTGWNVVQSVTLNTLGNLELAAAIDATWQSLVYMMEKHNPQAPVSVPKNGWFYYASDGASNLAMPKVPFNYLNKTPEQLEAEAEKTKPQTLEGLYDEGLTKAKVLDAQYQKAKAAAKAKTAAAKSAAKTQAEQIAAQQAEKDAFWSNYSIDWPWVSFNKIPPGGSGDWTISTSTNGQFSVSEPAQPEKVKKD